ncbi:hypothetical protein [Mucilaginibacter sp.]
MSDLEIIKNLVKIEIKYDDYFNIQDIWILNCVEINGREITIIKKDIPKEIIKEIKQISTTK